MKKILLFLILLLTISLAQAETLSYEQIDPEIKEILNIPDDGSVSITLNQQILDIPMAISQVNENYLPAGVTEDDVLITSGKVNVKASMKFFTHTTSTGPQDLTLIKKSITTKLKNYKIIEEIPTTIAQTIDNIYFAQTPEQLSTTPLVITVQGSENSDFYYIVQGNAIDHLSEMQTIVSPLQPIQVRGGYQEAVCGDGVCTSILEDKNTCPQDCSKKLRWGWIIFLIVVLTVIVIIFNKYRKKKKDLPSKNPFRSPLNEQNLRNYIKQAQQQGKTKEEITKVLLAKKWTKEQIDYILKASSK